MAQNTAGSNTYPLLPEGWNRVQVLTSERKKYEGMCLKVTFRLLSDGSTWTNLLNLPSTNVIPTKHIVSRLVAACHGKAEFAEGESFDDEIDPIGKIIEIESKHTVKGAKSAKAGEPIWKINDVRPAAESKITDDEVAKLKVAFKTVYANVDAGEIPAQVASSLKKWLKTDTDKKTADLTPAEATVVWARLEAMADAQNVTVER